MKFFTMIGILVVTAVSLMISAFIEAATFHKLWAWFVAHEYGAGPSLGAWYGLATIFSLAIGITTKHLYSKPGEDTVVIRMASNALAVLLACGLVLLIAFGVGSVFSWVH